MIYDAQKERHILHSLDRFESVWSGVFIASLEKAGGRFNVLSKAVSQSLYGGTDAPAIPQVESAEGELGLDDYEDEDDCGGAPRWFVNPLNFNVLISDMPVWHKPAFGPAVYFRLTYNSRATITGQEPFGSKWRFLYGSYLIEDSESGEVAVVMGDGRIDLFTPDGSDGYTRPYGKYNRLAKIDDNHFEVRTPMDLVFVFRIPDGSGLTTPHLVERRNVRGLGLTMGYNTSGQLETITDAVGQVTSLTYTDGKVIRVTDPFGRHADFEYTGDLLTRITDMGGIWAAIAYDGDANLTAIENERGITQFSIEGGGGANAATYPASGESLGAHKRITVTDPLGNKQEYYYNGLVGYGWHVSPRHYVEYVDSTTNNSADAVPKTLYYYVAETARGPREEIETILYPEGRQVTKTHDYDSGEVLSESDSYGNTTSYTYNAMGKLTSITPEVGAVTTFVYDPANDVDLTAINRAGLGSVTLTYNAYHEITSIEDMVGKRIDPIEYNSYGQVTSSTQIHDDHTIFTEFAYHPAGQPGARRLSQITRAGQTIAQYTYDSVGRVETATDAAGIALTYSYDDLNHITQVLYPDGHTVQASYSSCCPRLVDSITDRAGRTTTYDYDALERLIRITNPEGGATEYEYDPNGNWTGFTNPNRNRTAFEYDRENRLTRRIWPDGRVIQYAYDKNGRLDRMIDPRGIRSDYYYDDGKLVAKRYSDDTPAVTFEYDDYDRLVTVTDGLGTTCYTYYDDSRVHTIDGPWDNDTLTYSYDKLGRRIGVSPQLGRALSYVYDDLNRVTSVQADTRTFTYGYSGSDPRIQSLTGPENGQATYEYVDPLKRLTALINTDGSSQPITRFDYAYADTEHPDQISSETVTDGPGISFAADQVTTYTHNVVEQMTSDSTTGALAYDDAGNLIQGYTPAGHPFTAAYDAENRLVSIEYADGGTTYKTEFAYSASNFIGQIKKYENSSLVDDIRIVRDGLLALQERDSANQVTREYTWGAHMGGGIGGLLNMRQGGMDYTYYYDGKGNVSAVLDTASAVAVAYRYVSFGKVLAQTGALDQPFQFSTKRYYSELGLNYYGYRFYAPGVGKWLTRDPLGEVGGINLYAMVQNNPVNFVDPDGKIAKEVGLLYAFTGYSRMNQIQERSGIILRK
ncbi:hypothetical protein DSCA_25360 [Desulfosarcina alkanivorans]|uniref:Teneurin-like YD-shell domain-containing protein n=1 Tax=Desulfosarcina alkanivorans TaxID=571177 RepID=A0A5K7YHK6_9BACT|nr:hypothetical protein DSCA_25360 [Desulfosarcina alkanivorans]